jgi:tetratricopeptide (TPR) repeat protein
MIVKNGAASLARCLESVEGLVDRIVIGDTGSTDETVRLAEQFGAKVVPIPWEDDFSRARNRLLDHSQCDWILVLDADEMLDAEAHQVIPALLAQPYVDGYGVWIWNYVQELDFRSGGELAMRNPGHLHQARRYAAYFRSLSSRLFRRHRELYFEHCVHETVFNRLDSQGMRKSLAPFTIHHFGYVEDSRQDKDRKGNLYYQLAMRKLQAAPYSYQANLDAGRAELDHARRPRAALPYFQTACAIKPEAFAAWLHAGICLVQAGRHAEALDSLARAAALDMHKPLLHSTIGDTHFQLGSYVCACEGYKAAHALGDDSALTAAKWGAAEVQLGQRTPGLERIRQAITQNPRLGELYEILAGAAFLAGEHAEACRAADLRLSLDNANPYHFVLAATIHRHAHHPHRAAEVLTEGARSFPGNAEIAGMLVLRPLS